MASDWLVVVGGTAPVDSNNKLKLKPTLSPRPQRPLQETSRTAVLIHYVCFEAIACSGCRRKLRCIISGLPLVLEASEYVNRPAGPQLANHKPWLRFTCRSFILKAFRSVLRYSAQVHCLPVASAQLRPNQRSRPVSQAFPEHSHFLLYIIALR